MWRILQGDGTACGGYYKVTGRETPLCSCSKADTTNPSTKHLPGDKHDRMCYNNYPLRMYSHTNCHMLVARLDILVSTEGGQREEGNESATDSKPEEDSESAT